MARRTCHEEEDDPLRFWCKVGLLRSKRIVGSCRRRSQLLKRHRPDANTALLKEPAPTNYFPVQHFLLLRNRLVEVKQHTAQSRPCAEFSRCRAGRKLRRSVLIPCKFLSIDPALSSALSLL